MDTDRDDARSPRKAVESLEPTFCWRELLDRALTG